MVPPPMRRWTRSKMSYPPATQGTSAHAEMDPVRRNCGKQSQAVPPPMRRWTLLSSGTVNFSWGTSAHAEMDPIYLSRYHQRKRYLRPCGDGPSSTNGILCADAVPPPMRRWTRAIVSDGCSCSGTSAYAEINRNNPHPITGAPAGSAADQLVPDLITRSLPHPAVSRPCP